MASLSILSTTSARALVVGLAALGMSACTHYHDGNYRGGGYYYSDHDKRLDKRDRYDGYGGDHSKKRHARDDRSDDGRGDRRYSRRDRDGDDGDRRYSHRHRDGDDGTRRYSRRDRDRDADLAYDDPRRKRSHTGQDGREKYDGYYGRGGYDRGYRVCDSDGDRCYLSNSPYWDYRQYYRNHGYRWDDE